MSNPKLPNEPEQDEDNPDRDVQEELENEKPNYKDGPVNLTHIPADAGGDVPIVLEPVKPTIQ